MREWEWWKGRVDCDGCKDATELGVVQYEGDEDKKK